MSHHLAVVSRIVVAYPETCNDFTLELARKADMDNEAVRGNVLDVWLDKMPLVSQTDKKKLLGMGLANVLLLGFRATESRIYSILQNLAETLNDVMRPEENSYIDSLLITSTGSTDDSLDDFYTEHEVRKKEFSANDIVHKINLSEFVQAKITAWAQCIGEAAYGEIMSNLDVETKNMLKEYISL